MILLDGLRWSFLLRCDAHRPLQTESDDASLAIGENLAGSLIFITCSLALILLDDLRLMGIST